MARDATAFDPVTVPTDDELLILGELLLASQRKWFYHFRHFHAAAAPEIGAPAMAVRVPWTTYVSQAASLLDPRLQALAFAAHRLANAGWIDELRVTNAGITAALPYHFVEFPTDLSQQSQLPGEGPGLPARYLHAYHRLIEAHQQQLWNAVQGDLYAGPESVTDPLLVGTDIPHDLTTALVTAGIASCYEPDDRTHFGPQAAPEHGKAITLTVQDTALSQLIADLIRAA